MQENETQNYSLMNMETNTFEIKFFFSILTKQFFNGVHWKSYFLWVAFVENTKQYY